MFRRIKYPEKTWREADGRRSLVAFGYNGPGTRGEMFFPLPDSQATTLVAFMSRLKQGKAPEAAFAETFGRG